MRATHSETATATAMATATTMTTAARSIAAMELRELQHSTGGRHAVCEAASGTFSERALLLPGRVRTRAADESKSTALARATTIFVTSSPRPHDDRPSHAQQTVDAVVTTRRVLHLGASRTYVVFDGLRGKPSVTPLMVEEYGTKIRAARQRLPPAVTTLLMHSWMHMANSMRCAMVLAPPTPLVFVIQDDTQMRGPIDTELLTRHLVWAAPPSVSAPAAAVDATATALARKTGAPPIELIKFYMYPDCQVDPSKPGRRQIIMGSYPCTPHPATPLLHFSHHWQDRPHFATRAHYERRLFATLPAAAKVTPEQYLDRMSSHDKNWGIYTYGARGDMLRELHAPVRVNDTLVTREFVVAAQMRGDAGYANITVPYVHAYLVHAYQGRTQDFLANLKQRSGKIDKMLYRTKNPVWMDQQDARWGGLK